MAITLEQVNAAPRDVALQMLDGLYEHSPWVADKALDARPFRSLAHLKYVMTRVLQDAGQEPLFERRLVLSGIQGDAGFGLYLCPHHRP